MKKILYVLILIFSIGCAKEEACVDIDIARNSTITAPNNGTLVVDCSNCTVRLSLDGEIIKSGTEFNYPIKKSQNITIKYYPNSSGFASNYDVKFICAN